MRGHILYPIGAVLIVDGSPQSFRQPRVERFVCEIKAERPLMLPVHTLRVGVFPYLKVIGLDLRLISRSMRVVIHAQFLMVAR